MYMSKQAKDGGMQKEEEREKEKENFQNVNVCLHVITNAI